MFSLSKIILSENLRYSTLIFNSFFSQSSFLDTASGTGGKGFINEDGHVMFLLRQSLFVVQSVYTFKS